MERAGATHSGATAHPQEDVGVSNSARMQKFELKCSRGNQRQGEKKDKKFEVGWWTQASKTGHRTEGSWSRSSHCPNNQSKGTGVFIIERGG